MKIYFLVGAMVGLSYLAHADMSLKTQMETLNIPIRAALLKSDVSGYKRILLSRVAPNFVYTEGDTTMNFAQMVGRIRWTYSGYTKVESLSLQLISAKEQGTNGIVEQRLTRQAITNGPDNKPHKLKSVEAITAHCRKVQGYWQFTAMSMTTEKISQDGKPMPIGGAKHAY
jgi:hypothetical protein